MTPLKLRELRTVCPTIDDKQFRIFCGTILGRQPPADSDIAPEEAALTYLYEWLLSWGKFDGGQIERLLKKLQPDLEKDVKGLSGIKTGSFVLTIVEWRYFIWSGSLGFYDAETNEDLAEVPHPTPTWVVCQFGDLLLQKMRWRFKLRRSELEGTSGS